MRKVAGAVHIDVEDGRVAGMALVLRRMIDRQVDDGARRTVEHAGAPVGIHQKGIHDAGLAVGAGRSGRAGRPGAAVVAVAFRPLATSAAGAPRAAGASGPARTCGPGRHRVAERGARTQGGDRAVIEDRARGRAAVAAPAAGAARAAGAAIAAVAAVHDVAAERYVVPAVAAVAAVAAHPAGSGVSAVAAARRVVHERDVGERERTEIDDGARGRAAVAAVAARGPGAAIAAIAGVGGVEEVDDDQRKAAERTEVDIADLLAGCIAAAPATAAVTADAVGGVAGRAGAAGPPDRGVVVELDVVEREDALIVDRAAGDAGGERVARVGCGAAVTAGKSAAALLENIRARFVLRIERTVDAVHGGRGAICPIGAEAAGLQRAAAALREIEAVDHDMRLAAEDRDVRQHITIRLAIERDVGETVIVAVAVDDHVLIDHEALYERDGLLIERRRKHDGVARRPPMRAPRAT